MEATTMEIMPAKAQEADVIARDFLPVMSWQIALKRREQIVEFAKQVLKEGEDYGAIPGTSSKPVLLKAGAEKLCYFFGLEPCFEQVTEEADWTGERHGGEAFFYIRYRCQLRRGERTVGAGEGSCNSWESKYRWRQSGRKCPQCGVEAIIAGKEEFGGGFICWKKRNGCGAQFKSDDPAITSQQAGRVPNADIYDQVNTIQKMAQKRALVQAVLIGTGASEFYTQDLEDVTGASAIHVRTPQQDRGPVEQSAAVRDRKLAELRQTVQPKVEVVPEAVQSVWNRMGSNREAIKQALADVYGDLMELGGSETARIVYDDISKRYGAGDPASKVSLARQVILQMWKACEHMRGMDVSFPPEQEEASNG
jgi:hypothetical protein